MSERGISLYWRMRTFLDGFPGDKYKSLRDARTKLSTITWANVKERKAVLKNRDVILQAAIKRASNEDAESREDGEWRDAAQSREDRKSQRRLILEGLFSAVESDGACAAALENPRLAALIVARCQTVADEIVKMELCASTSGTNIRQKILHPAVWSFKNLNALLDASPRTANRLLVESLRHAVFRGYTVGNEESEDGITTATLILSWGVVVDNLVYKGEEPGQRFERVLEVTVKRNDRDSGTLKQKNITLYGCFDKTVGRYSISPAMIVVLHLLMAGMFDDAFTTIGDAFEGAMAKFLFVAAQVFCGRPVSELVDFVIGPKAIVGNNVENVCTQNVKTVLVRLRQCNDASAVWSGTSKADELHRNAFVEISPVNLPSADLVLHIPGTITLVVKCKDVATAMPPEEVREVFANYRGQVFCKRKYDNVGDTWSTYRNTCGSRFAFALSVSFFSFKVCVCV